MRPLMIGMTLLALAACATDYSDAGTCSGYGFQPGATPFAQCLQNEQMDRDNQAATFLGGQGAFRHQATCTNIGGIVSCR